MTKNTWLSAPAGVLGQGGADARPLGVGTGIGLLGATPPPPVLQGSGLPAARLRHIGVDLVPAGTAPAGTVLTGPTAVESYGTPCGGFTAPIDGTTLGSHPSSRPLS